MQLHPPWNGRLHGNEGGESGGGRFGTKSPPTFRLAAMQQLRDFNVHGIPRASFQLGNSCFDADIGEGVLHEGRIKRDRIERTNSLSRSILSDFKIRKMSVNRPDMLDLTREGRFNAGEEGLEGEDP